MAIISTLSGENRIILGNDRFARQPLFMQSSTWQKLRIGLRLCMADSGASVSPASFNLGICKGNTSIWGDSGAAPLHYVGMNWVGNFATFTRVATPVVHYEVAFSSGNCFVNGAQSSTVGVDMEPSSWCIGAADTNRTLLFLDIIKSPTTWTMSYFRNTNTACTDVSKATFDAQVILPTPSLTDHSYQTPGTLAVNEATNGFLDHINLSWNFSAPTVKISDITVVKFA